VQKGVKMLAFYLSLIENETEKKKFEEVYLTYRKQMFTLANSILKNEQDAEDVVHDVFCFVASSHLYVINKAEDLSDIRNYLLKSVKNASMSLVRKRNIQLKYFDRTQEKIKAQNENEFIDEVCLRLDCQDIIEVMESLDEKYREVLYYHFVLDLTISETAELLNRNFNTVQKQLVRGKELLLKKIPKGGTRDVDEKR
jgi:RNA polymerase sigma-70 factor (ECF subfamily)